MMLFRDPTKALLLVALASCSTPKSADATAAAPPPPVESAAQPPKAPEPAASTVAATQSAAAPTASASAAPVTSASAPPADEPIPKIKVANIGMHIGGGPNDAVTKEPIKKSVEPHFDEIKRCWRKVDDPKKSGDFGVDLRIPKDGGKAQTSHVRTTVKGEGFGACVLDVFKDIDFLKPKKGETIVSYSIRFTP